MDPQWKERDGEPSAVPPRLIYREPPQRNERQDKDPSLVEARSRLRIEMVIRAVREHRSRGS